MNRDDLKSGDLVKITDGSYAVKVNGFKPYPSIGLSKEPFEFVSKAGSNHLTNGSQGDPIKVHNIFIKSTLTGDIYLHSAAFVRLAQPVRVVKVVVPVVKCCCCCCCK